MNSSTLAIGSHAINLTASAAGYEEKWVIITIIVTQIHTDLEPSTIRLEIPSGNTEVFTIDWTDLDNSLAINDVDTTYLDNWTGSVSPIIIWTGSQFQVTFEAAATDTLGTYLVWFNFTKGAEYQPGYCEIQIEIRSHDTILTADSPPPTAQNAIINITAYFYDFDNKVGIKDALVDIYVENATGAVSSTFEYNLILGDGFYTIHIPASQFDVSSQTFTVYVEWLGAVQQYENNNVVVAVTVEGVKSLMTLTAAADPSAYLEIMIYNFTYTERDSGIGITNTSNPYGSGLVYISVSFNVPFDMGYVSIIEVDEITKPGLYQILIDTAGFDNIGQFTMTINIDWTGAEPYYDTREDTVTVWVLARDTLLLINPPSPESYDETATFTFNWEDTTLGTDILDSAELDIWMNVTFGEAHNAGEFTITFDTSQFPGVGTYVMILNVTWDGIPFYANRTTQVSITVLNRQTTLDYPTPDPTFYDDNVTITITWTDVTNGGSDGILGAIIVVTDDNGVIPSNEYDIRPFAGGVYEIEFDTVRFATTGSWNITIYVSSSATGIVDRATSRFLDVRQRRTILSYEAIGKVAYGESIEFVMYFDDLYTSSIIGNGTGDVTLEILTAGTWVFTSTWNAVEAWYDIVITSYPSQLIGIPFDIEFRMTYDNVAPFYDSDDLTGSFELRERLSLLSLEIAPNPTPYLDNATFLVQFLDVDADSGISADYFWVYFGPTNLTHGLNYTYESKSGGYFEISVNSTVFGGIGQYGIAVYAFWTSGVPYHNNASASVNVRVTTRDTIVDITVPPSQTPFQDNVTFTFEYVDLFRGTAITSILATDISLYKNDTLVDSGNYTLTPSGNGFIFTVNSETLGDTLGRYNLTIVIDWNEATSPFYVDAQATTWVSVTTRTLSFALDPLEETRYGDLLNITFTLTDMSTGALVDDAEITFASQTLTLTEGDDYNITGVGGGSGDYIIRVDSLALSGPGNFLFDLDVGWNSGKPYYRPMNTIVLTGVISDIETVLIPLSDQVNALWKNPAEITVDYVNLLWMNPTSGAVVDYEWANGVGIFTEIGFTGSYYGSIDTSLGDAGTYVVTITATLDDYEVARAYVTIVVQVLPSAIDPVDPPLGSLTLPRGSAINVTIYLRDIDNTLPIADGYVVLVTATFEGYTVSFSYTGTPGKYNALIPANGPTIQPQGAYTLLVEASFDNFAPTSYIFNIDLQASITAIILSGETVEDMAVVYSEIIQFTVNLTKPDFGGELFANATLEWDIVAGGWFGDFISNGDGTFYAVLDTSTLAFGIWPVTIKAHVWANSSTFTGSLTQLALTITRIQTDVIRPTNVEASWGWSGNLTFIYNGTFGPIDDAVVEYTGEILVGTLYELPNGVYLIEVDTTLANPGIFTVSMVFQKVNYQEAPVGIQFIVNPATTDIFIDSVTYTPTYEEVLDDLVNLELPFGDIVTIDFFYNDTDSGNDFAGGLAGALSTANSYLRGPSIEAYLNVTVLDLGGGLYRVIFDSTDAEIDAGVSSEPYRFYIEMSMENRTISDILIRITVIDIPTQLTIVDDVPIWYLTNGESLTIELLYMDTWHNTGIDGAYFSANASTGAQFSVDTSEGPTPGQYFVTLTADGIKLSSSSGAIIIMLGDGVYTLGEDTLFIELGQNGTDVLVSNSIVYGLPIGLVVLLIGFAYLRVWSVPKRLRQINAQIKTIRKGKVPKPITEAASRQDLVADLFNDTYAKLEITRTPDQMPEEAVPVDVPELGELLIQLAILTNLDQQELDDFKTDIAKMKISEQAAFVKEVIVQEAIRAARRDHKTVETVLEEVQDQASKRLAGEGEGAVVVEGIIPEEVETEVDTVILPDKDETIETDTTPTFDDDGTPDTETVESSDDKLSQFEIEELQKDLETKGVPLHEIDVIVKQAQKLPRDLVDELIKSLDRDRGTE
ncbi:MAG: hypothetical protein RTV31_08025 [Candidatus Thorarchaeota archaeon]